jgi:N-formylglutamate amidohydrolase
VRSILRHVPAACAVAAAFVLAACADDPVSVRTPSPAPSAVAQVSAPTAVYEPGGSYFPDANEDIEYFPGNLPVIFTAPHGGSETPAAIPTRVAGAACGSEVTTARDLNTAELALAIRSAYFARTGKYPHVVINRLHRNRLDANRDLKEAACGNARTEKAWHDYHRFIDDAKARITADFGRGWYTDLHGHGHDIPQLELGYELSATTLRRTDADLDASTTVERAMSIRTFSEQSPLSVSALLRGPTALGTLFTNAGVPSVPSQQRPAPAVGEPYFNGGYNTDRHACSNGGQICGVQIESHNEGVRDNAANRARFAVTLVSVYAEYLAQFGITFPTAPRPGLGTALIVQHENAFNDATYARFEASGNWTLGSNMSSYNRVNFRLASASTSATNDGAEFLFYVATPGTYTVDAWWSSVSTRSSGASYRVFETDGGVMLADLKRSQRENGGQWNALGRYRFTQVGWAKVLMSRSLSTPDGSLSADAVRVTQVNTPPVAAFASPAAADEGSAAAFDGSASTDADGDALSYAWTFGDGATGSGATPTHTYANDGAYQVTLTVTDRYGAQHAATREVAIRNVAPTVTLAGGATLLPGERFTSGGTFTDPGADSWTATATWGDGTDASPLTIDGRGFVLEHRYARAGTFTVEVTVHDGRDAGRASVQVIVQTPAQGVAALGALVTALVDRGVVAAGTGNSLQAKLDAAARQIERDNANAAGGQLGAFVNEVEAMARTGRLPAADAAALTTLAQRIVRSMAAM